ncbi:MAG: hypothetical protein GPOALKHO_001442 [Sodalis sp.]|uniref:hypothetical protein n=1 Tax=Sodalis sp. (in: enterobacteria) TaxID=1898979 RepID=UPI003873A564|nr:MAG: hypothetical protein GPOALKHO_001442 [Sodalis sp.]
MKSASGYTWAISSLPRTAKVKSALVGNEVVNNNDIFVETNDIFVETNEDVVMLSSFVANQSPDEGREIGYR